MSFLPPALLAIFWMWMDFVGLFLSVVSTSFYFGWSISQKVLWIFITALFVFSGPLFFFLLSRFISAEKLLKGLLAAQFLIYITITYYRDDSLFPWLVTLGAWISGMALMGVFALFKHMLFWSLPFYTLIVSLFFYLSARLNGQGVALVFMPLFSKGASIAPWVILSLSVLAGLFLPIKKTFGNQPISSVDEASLPQPQLWQRTYGLALGLLLSPALGLIYNLHIWSAQTPDYKAMIYLSSLVIGTGLAWILFTRLPQFRWAYLLLGLGSIGISLYTILGTSNPLGLTLIAHGLGCFGMGVFLLFYIYRYVEISKSTNGFYPVVSLQIGFVLFLFILAIFLLKSNPNGFWVGLIGSFIVLLLGEIKSTQIEMKAQPLQRLWYVTFGLFLLPGLMAFIVPPAQGKVSPLSKDKLTIMTSNIRYGWTDDYRFEPSFHLNTIKSLKADIIGFQEVNKGHTSGAYMDLYQYYKHHLPGNWSYGDANFGFGNALISKYPVLHSETKTYQAKDILRRSAQVLTIEFQGRQIDVYNTHLSHIAPPNPIRVAQAKELKGWIKASGRPWVLMGDFNATPNSKVIKGFLEIASPIFKKNTELLSQLTHPGIKPELRIDYIFFSPDFELVKQEVLENKGSSDHKMIRSVLQFKKPN